MRKSSSDTCVKYGLPAHSPTAHTFGAVVSKRSFTRMCPSSGDVDSHLFQADSLCVWRTPKRSENVRSFYRSCVAFALNLQMHAVSRNAPDIQNLRAQ